LTYMAYKDLGDGNIEMLDRFKYDPQSIQDQQVKEQEEKQKAKLQESIKEREEIEKKKAAKKVMREKWKASQSKPLSQSFKEEIGL